MKQDQLENLQFMAESYERKYKPHVEIFESSIIGRHVGRSASHINALGKMLDSWEQYKAKKESNGTIATLGDVPTVAAGVITASFASNSMNVICNVQPLPEQSANIYFEETKSSSTRGNVAAGQLLLSPNAMPEVFPVNYSGNAVTTVIGQTSTTAATLNFPAAAPQKPVLPRTVTVGVAFSTGAEIAVDDGQGGLIGKTFGGTIDYNNGNLVLNFFTQPNEVVDISLGYGYNQEAAKSEVEIEVDLKTVNVSAKMYALKAQLGIFKQFTLEQRFGIDGKERLAVRLTQELNNELTNEAIAKMITFCPKDSKEEWNKKPKAGTTWIEHKLEFLDVIARAENNLQQKAGRGKISTLVCAPNVATIIRNLPGFVPAGVVGPGATIYGTLDDITIVRAPQLAMDSNAPTANSAFAIYRGEEPFDGAMVYAPYMPIVSIEDVPVEQTVLMKRNGVAHMAAIACPSPNFISRIDVVEK
uniref:Major capsid protein n=1 Tax=Siphoviridae sp. ctYh54 TaxID=2826379 RepID=A0A8S5MDV5_9CAUD|nr:MAG TPA: major capsid protein [Siphoviridae sp. ctYh54]